jgi:lysophospholipase L1-like esterase
MRRSFTIFLLLFLGCLLNAAEPSNSQFRAAPSKAELNQWETTIKAFEASDKTNAPPKDAILFVGSSSIRLWKTLEKDFAGHQVINRGFGGSQISDSVRYAERLVLAYQPKAVVFYAGDNDIHTGKSPRQVANDFERFAHKVHWALPKTQIFFISIKPSPSRWHHKNSIEAANLLIKTHCRLTRNLSFIDVYHKMLDETGKPREELFVKDRLHLNAEGYALWTAIIEPHLADL